MNLIGALGCTAPPLQLHRQSSNYVLMVVLYIPFLLLFPYLITLHIIYKHTKLKMLSLLKLMFTSTLILQTTNQTAYNYHDYPQSNHFYSTTSSSS